MTTPEKRTFVQNQYYLILKDEPPQCGCGTLLRFSTAYRCLYCKEFFCEECAEGHFEETVESRNEYFKYLEDKKNAKS